MTKATETVKTPSEYCKAGYVSIHFQYAMALKEIVEEGREKEEFGKYANVAKGIIAGPFFKRNENADCIGDSPHFNFITVDGLCPFYIKNKNECALGKSKPESCSS